MLLRHICRQCCFDSTCDGYDCSHNEAAILSFLPFFLLHVRRMTHIPGISKIIAIYGIISGVWRGGYLTTIIGERTRQS